MDIKNVAIQTEDKNNGVYYYAADIRETPKVANMTISQD